MMSFSVMLPRLMFLPGGSLSLVPCSSMGVSVQGGGLCNETPLNRKSRQYAFYWNAFLLSNKDCEVMMYGLSVSCEIQFGALVSQFYGVMLNYPFAAVLGGM